MTFKDLQRLVQSQSGPGDNQILQRLKDKPFWLWDPTSHKQADGKVLVTVWKALPKKEEE